MKLKLSIIVLLALASLPLCIADDYVDDIYYYPQDDALVIESTTPSYDKNIRELIFLAEDSTVVATDTLRVDNNAKK